MAWCRVQQVICEDRGDVVVMSIIQEKRMPVMAVSLEAFCLDSSHSSSCPSAVPTRLFLQRSLAVFCCYPFLAPISFLSLVFHFPINV